MASDLGTAGFELLNCAGRALKMSWEMRGDVIKMSMGYWVFFEEASINGCIEALKVGSISYTSMAWLKCFGEFVGKTNGILYKQYEGYRGG